MISVVVDSDFIAGFSVADTNWGSLNIFHLLFKDNNLIF